MSLTPRLTLIGLYKYNPAVFSNLSLPASVDEEIFIDSLMLEYGECPLIYPDYDFMKLAIGAWSRKWYANIERIAAAINAEYNPLHNYDRTETWTENETGNTEATTNTDITNSGSDENKVSAYNESDYQPSNKTEYESTENNEKTYNEDNTRNNVKTGRAYGNIGVTTSTEMLQQELNIRRTENLYHIISELFYREFCLYIF